MSGRSPERERGARLPRAGTDRRGALGEHSHDSVITELNRGTRSIAEGRADAGPSPLRHELTGSVAAMAWRQLPEAADPAATVGNARTQSCALWPSVLGNMTSAGLRLCAEPER